MNPTFLPPETYLHNGMYQLVASLEQDDRQLNYLARHTASGKAVVIKEFFPKAWCLREDNLDCSVAVEQQARFAQFKARFLTKTQAFLQIRHPNILKVLDSFEEKQTAYCVLEKMEGQALQAFVKTHKALSLNKGLQLVLKVGSALEYLHDRGILHTQVNPETIFVGSKGEVKLSSFENQNVQGYTPKEAGDPAKALTPSFDVYALGASLYFLTTKQDPQFRIPEEQQGLVPPQHLNPGISNSLNAVILRAMAYQAADRFQDMQAFFKAVQQIEHHSTATPPSSPDFFITGKEPLDQSELPQENPPAAPVEESAEVPVIPPVEEAPTLPPKESLNEKYQRVLAEQKANPAKEEIKINLPGDLISPTQQPVAKKQPREVPSSHKTPPVEAKPKILPTGSHKNRSPWLWMALFVFVLVAGIWYWAMLPVEPLPDLLQTSQTKREQPSKKLNLSPAEKTVHQFIEHLGAQRAEKAYALQKNPKWKDRKAFLSKDKGFGGITQTKIRRSELLNKEDGKAKVKLKYLSVDPTNDLNPIKKYNRYCSAPGVVYEQAFYLEKLANKWYIIKTEVLNAVCEAQ